LNDTVIATCKERRVRINSERHDFILERKIDDITYGLQPEYSRLLHTMSEENAFNRKLHPSIESRNQSIRPL
jgi:uncharacterized FlgJ-related protein